jgi:glycosyltransferase involved in cell wall biosynthesis
MKPIRLLFFTPTFGTGGSEKVVLDLCRHLPHYDYEIGVCTFFAGTYDSLLRGLGIMRAILVPEGAYSQNLAALKAVRFVQRLARLKSLFSEFQPQILHTHHLGPLFHADMVLRLGRCDIRWVHTEHNVPDLENEYGCLPMRWTHSLCRPDRLTGVSPSVVRCLTQVTRVPVPPAVLVPNGIELASFIAAAATPQPRSDLGLPPSGRLIGCVGNLRVEKNHRLALLALARLVSERMDVHLVLCGDGDQRSHLESLTRTLGIADRVTFLGYRLDVPQILAALDLLLIPSRYEGLPLSVLEAWAASRPIVATAVPGICDLIQDGEDGLLVPPEDPNQMAAAIQRVLEEPELAGRLSFGGGQRVLEYGIDRMVAGYDRLYRELIGGSKCAA